MIEKYGDIGPRTPDINRVREKTAAASRPEKLAKLAEDTVSRLSDHAKAGVKPAGKPNASNQS